jgi:hypothetical protein
MPPKSCRPPVGSPPLRPATQAEIPAGVGEASDAIGGQFTMTYAILAVSAIRAQTVRSGQLAEDGGAEDVDGLGVGQPAFVTERPPRPERDRVGDHRPATAALGG